MATRKAKANVKLDKEEKELLESVEKGEWRSVKNKRKLLTHAQEASENFLKKDARINIRISSLCGKGQR